MRRSSVESLSVKGGNNTHSWCFLMPLNVRLWQQWVLKFDRGGRRSSSKRMECLGDPSHRRKIYVMEYVENMVLRQLKEKLQPKCVSVSLQLHSV